jgi:predicted dehydrogenase
MTHKIRLGFVGANVRANWASQSHFPALLASPDVELTAVCTTRPESAAEARIAIGAKLAFHDFRAMVASPEIDAVAVVVQVPLHYEPTRAAIEAGKHVYTEWPLGRTTAEAEALAAVAGAQGVQTGVGLQSRVSPTLMYLKEQIAAGYVGEMLAWHATAMRDGALARPSSRTRQRDASLGANTLTIATGHVIDALRFVAGHFVRVACLVTTQARQWYETDIQQLVEVGERLFGRGIRDPVPLPNRWRRDPQELKALGVERVSCAIRSLENVPRPARWSGYNGQPIDCRSLHRPAGEVATMHG